MSGPIESSNPQDPPIKDGSDPNSPNPLDQYFANKPKSLIGDELTKKVDEYYNYLQTSGRWRLFSRSYEYYYNGQQRGAQLQRTGAQDEYTTLYVNHYRNIIQHLLVNTTSQRPEYEPHATNTDYKSQAQTIVAKGVLEYYNRAAHLDRYNELTMEKCLLYGEGTMVENWDANLGEDYIPNPDDPDHMFKQGDVKIDTFGPADVIRDYTLSEFMKGDWIITREFANKYTEAARYPDLAEKLLSLSLDPSVWRERQLGRPFIETESHLIPKFRFYHEKTSAVPQGRLVEFFGTDLISIDTALPYKKIPAYRAAASEQDGTPFGYTVGWDLLAIQQTIDALYSTITTNQATFGVQNILMPTGANIGVVEVIGGLNIIKYNPKLGKPESMNLTSTPKEIYDYIKQLEHLMETLSGVNSVTRGNPEASLKSGAALALVASQAIQFNSGLEKTYTHLLEDSGTGIVDILKEYATTPRIAMIAGKAQRPLLKEFTGQDLSEIDRITVDRGNPLSRTTAGRMQIADTLIQNKHIKNADEYLQLVTTGRLEPMIEGQQAQSLLIRAENEKMAEGKVVTALDIDDHRMHIIEHGVVLSSPEARANPQIVQTVLNHVMEHVQALQNANPVLLSLYGQPQVPKPPQQPPGPPGAPPGGGPPPLGVLTPGNPAMEAGNVPLPKMPTMPQNPLQGGGEFNNQNGGLPPNLAPLP